MNIKAKNTQLIILGVTALICSRTMLVLFNDPEGPNLVVVIGMAIILYSLSFTLYVPKPRTAGTKKLICAILIQILAATTLYFFLR